MQNMEKMGLNYCILWSLGCLSVIKFSQIVMVSIHPSIPLSIHLSVNLSITISQYPFAKFHAFYLYD